jgi:alkylated DNA repair protein alkB family protein 6
MMEHYSSDPIVRTYLHGIAERTREEASHLSRLVNSGSVRDTEIKAKLQSASQCKPDGESDLDQYDVLIREKRVSLTFRDVEKVSKGLSPFLFKH